MTEDSVQAFIPAFNEEGTLGTVLERTYEVLKRNCRSFEVVVYDDGSTDRTASIAEGFAKSHPSVRVVHGGRNRGWGYVVKYAYLNASLDWIVVVDADMQFDPYDLEKFFPHLPSHDVIISGREDRKDKLSRKFITYVDKLLLKLLFSVSFYDLHWMKFIRTSFIDKATITGESPFVETDILVRAHRRGGRVKQFYLPHYPRTHGEAKGASLKNIVMSVRDMLSLYFKLMRQAPGRGKTA